jgi:DME family drug/metabolite transporter
MIEHRSLAPCGRRPSPRARGATLQFHSRGYLFIALAACLWGTLGLLFRILHDNFGLSSLTVAFLRASVSAILLIAFALTKIRATHLGASHVPAERNVFTISPRDVPFFALYGFCGVAAFYFFYVQAVIQTSVTTAVVLLYTAPAFVSLMAWQFWREPMNARKVIAIAVAFLGCALIARAYDVSALQLNALGLLIGLGAGFTYALYTIFSKFALAQHSSTTALVFALLFGAIFLAPLQNWDGFAPLVRQPAAWFFVIALAVGPTLGALTLYNAGLTRVPASNASLVATLEPVVASILAFFVLGERLEIAQMIGGVMVIGAAVGLNIADNA